MARLNIKISAYDKPGSTRNVKPLDISLDQRPVEEIGWGEQGFLEISAGTHELTVTPRKLTDDPIYIQPPSQTVSFETREKETVDIMCFYTQADGWSVFQQDHQFNTKIDIEKSTAAAFLLGGIHIVIGVCFLLCLYYLNPSEWSILQFSVNWPLMTNAVVFFISGLTLLICAFFINRGSSIGLIIAMILVGLHIVGVVVGGIPDDSVILIGRVLNLLVHFAALISLISGFISIRSATRKQAQL
jgi:hypothetical protein